MSKKVLFLLAVPALLLCCSRTGNISGRKVGEQLKIITVAAPVQTEVDDELLLLSLSNYLNVPEDLIVIKRYRDEEKIVKDLRKGKANYALLPSQLLEESPLNVFSIKSVLQCGDSWYALFSNQEDKTPSPLEKDWDFLF